MAKKNKHPRWWQVGPFVLVMEALYFLERQAPLSTTGHVVVQLGILLLVYGLLFLWVNANQGAWLYESYEAEARQITVRTVPPCAEPSVISGENGSQDQPFGLDPVRACREEIEVSPVTQEME
jgi:hypothetical protein